MPRTLIGLALAVVAAGLLAPPSAGRPDEPKGKAAPQGAGFFKYHVQEIDTKLNVGYAVVVADVNGDGKPDIVVVDTDKVYWYENPGSPGAEWKRRTMVEHQTKADNVCIAAADIDGDGKVDFALGAGWKPFDTKVPGTLQWLRRAGSLDDPWEVHPIPCDEPTVHRIRFADLDGDGKPQLVVAPIMGRDATRAGNWTDGRPVRLLAYKIPADPVKGPWEAKVIDESLHVVHNFTPVPAEGRKGMDLLAASYEGLTRLTRDAGGHWAGRRVGEGYQETPLASRGASEVKAGKVAGGPFIATIEPFHGNRVVAYTPPADPKKLWERKVLDSRLRWGHAVWCADLDGDGSDELIIGVRDDPARGDEFTDPRGVRVYRSRDATWRAWDRVLVDAGGVAVEDLTAADLDGDGRVDVVAVGRQTGNVRIYWNQK